MPVDVAKTFNDKAAEPDGSPGEMIKLIIEKNYSYSKCTSA